jgi:hypothetical protein
MIPSFSKIFLGSTIALALYGTAFVVEAGIDLTPTVNEYTAEGMKFQQLTFQYNEQRIQYEPPSRWTFDGNSAELHLKPPQKNFAEAVITAVPLSKPQVLDENAIKPLEQQFIAGLPVGSQFAKIEEEIASPVLLGGNASFEVTVSYQLTGEKFLRSALFVNLRDTQLIFRFTARKDDFQALHREFKASIFSWRWIESGEPTAEVAKTTGPASVR